MYSFSCGLWTRAFVLIQHPTKYKSTYVLKTLLMCLPTFVVIVPKIFFLLFLLLLFSHPNGHWTARRQETGVFTFLPCYVRWVNEFCEPWSNLVHYQSQKPWKYKREQKTLHKIQLLLRFQWLRITKINETTSLYRVAQLQISWSWNAVTKESLPNKFPLRVKTARTEIREKKNLSYFIISSDL